MSRRYVLDTRVDEDLKATVVETLAERGVELSERTWGVVRTSATHKAAMGWWETSRDYLWLAVTTLRSPPRTPLTNHLANQLEGYMRKAANTLNELREELDN